MLFITLLVWKLRPINRQHRPSNSSNGEASSHVIKRSQSHWNVMDLEMTPQGHGEQAQEEAVVFQRLWAWSGIYGAAWPCSSRPGCRGVRGRVWMWSDPQLWDHCCSHLCGGSPSSQPHDSFSLACPGALWWLWASMSWQEGLRGVTQPQRQSLTPGIAGGGLGFTFHMSIMVLLFLVPSSLPKAVSVCLDLHGRPSAALGSSEKFPWTPTSIAPPSESSCLPSFGSMQCWGVFIPQQQGLCLSWLCHQWPYTGLTRRRWAVTVWQEERDKR